MFCVRLARGLCTFFILIHIVRSLEISDFYDYEKSFRLENGADKSGYRKLETSLNFFSDFYDHVYINTQGVLTFNGGLNGFANMPFPLEYAAIAPFYSNVDTTNSGPDTSITFSTLQTERNSRLAYEIVRRNFPKKVNFRALNVVVATWENVGFFRGNNSAQNTFQVAIINGEQDTFVQFLYPSNGLNWLQGEYGESGLPDIRAQAGFVAEDGRFFKLPGSGTDNAKYLSQLSNHGVTGSWIYRVGYIDFESNIEEPDQSRYQQQENSVPRNCNAGGRLKCHVSALCQDNRYGFECQCKSGYYGNGFHCIKNDVPLRVSGKVYGKIDESEINCQIQSYVVLSDGRSYTAISPVAADVGYKAQLAYTIGYAVGWLFAKPVGNDVQNGYQITGGKLTNTISVRFLYEDANYELMLVQRFSGLNVWDQLSVDIEVKGNLPNISSSSSISFYDTSDSYVFTNENQIRSDSVGQILLDDKNVSFSISQAIEFERPLGSSLQFQGLDGSPIFNKVSKISAHYQNNEQALRIGMINRVVKNTPINPCTDGTAICAENAICVPDPQHDSYSCECKNGFAFDERDASTCIDIDECSTNSNICDQNADCFNELGGYTCRCRNGFYGNGYNCHLQQYEVTSEDPLDTTTIMMPNIPGLAPHDWLCDQCSEHADCNQGICVCQNGWNGNGIECVYNCPDEYVWNVDRCIRINSNSDDDENEVVPFCHLQGCSCPTGYVLIESDSSNTCRLVEKEESEEKLPCDVDNSCHRNANCLWVESELRNKCVCNAGFEGNGYECSETEISCLIENICDIHASCIYDEHIGKSVCKCIQGYEGDGRSCQLAADCSQDEDCKENAHCLDDVCICNDGFERDVSDFCVPTDFCGGTFCATNAVCLWDNKEHVQYCSCPDGFLGDGIQSCKSIPPTCNVKNNCGLNAQCQPKDNTYECTCNSGFYGDGFICAPEVNCLNMPNLCHEYGRCVSTNSGYQCVCNTGYVGNGSYCQSPIRQENGFLLLSQGIATVKIPFDGKGSSPIVTSSMAIGVDKDCSTGRVYWSDISMKQILSSNYDGTDKKVFISEDIVSPEGIAIDWISRRIYWTDSSKDTIEVASLDNGTVRAIVIKTGLVNPRGIAVDPNQNKLYWSDWNRASPKIEQADLDGSNRLTLLTAPAINLPNSLAISNPTGELCFADAGTHKVECIEPYRGTVRTVATDLTYPFGLAIANDRLYWTDWTTKRIEISDDSGKRYPGISSILFGNHKMYGMTAVTSECPLFFSQCQINNGDCPPNSICLVNPNQPSGRHCQPTS